MALCQLQLMCLKTWPKPTCKAFQSNSAPQTPLGPALCLRMIAATAAEGEADLQCTPKPTTSVTDRGTVLPAAAAVTFAADQGVPGPRRVVDVTKIVDVAAIAAVGARAMGPAAQAPVNLAARAAEGPPNGN